jgi:2,3-bisphosphoglycerate-dependent phosphoglycerate mutase
MSVSLWAGQNHKSVGAASFFNAFFSTVCYHLEGQARGSVYPVLMLELCSGKVRHEHARMARDELRDIRKGLSNLRPEMVVWDLEHLDAAPPWGTSISGDIRSLKDYFRTSDGEDLLVVLDELLKVAERERQDVVVR